MARPTTAQLAALLTAWRNGSELLDTLGPRTDALLAQLVSAPKPVLECQIVDTAQMSDSALRAHYAKTAHVEDIRFHLACATRRHDGSSVAWLALLGTVEANSNKPTTYSKARYWALCQRDRERRPMQIKAARIARKLAARRVDIKKAA